MRCHIIGVGGVGGYFGGLLARAGEDVTFIARGEHYRAMRESGLRVKSVRGDFHIPNPRVIESIGSIRNPELMLVFVKTYHTAEIAAALREVVRPETTIITFQTGLENDLEILKHVPAARVFPGLAYINSSRTAPGLIEQISGQRALVFGARGGDEDPVLAETERMFQNARLSATLSRCIEREMWIKLVWISALAGMTVLFRSEIGPVANHPEGYALFRKCLEEGFLLAKKRGAGLTPDDRKTMIEKIEYFRSEGGSAKTSLLMDIEHGRRTEVETMHGTLVRHARELGIDVPALQVIYAIVKVHDDQVRG